jgi:hypothetical protein
LSSTESYQKAAALRKPSERGELELETIGGGALPVSKTAVSRKSLVELARQPEVIAIPPNQKIHLIEPKRIDYDALGKQEAKDSLTWGPDFLVHPTNPGGRPDFRSCLYGWNIDGRPARRRLRGLAHDSAAGGPRFGYHPGAQGDGPAPRWKGPPAR